MSYCCLRPGPTVRWHLHPLPTRRSSDLTERPQISFRIGATEFIAAVVGALRFAQNRGRGLLCASEHLVDVIGSHVDRRRDRKSTRLNSSHVASSYAVFCLNKKS